MKTLRQITLTILTLTCLNTVNISCASSATQVGRYMTSVVKPNHGQMNLLSQTIKVRFPLNTQTVGDAMNYLLNFSGYSLIASTKMSEPLRTTISKPLPVVDRELGPVSLRDGLTTLVGPAFYLVEDPINRTVDFRLKSAYRKIYFSNKQTAKRG
jgi:conjugative transfer region protein (TIGR03748 family)